MQTRRFNEIRAWHVDVAGAVLCILLALVAYFGVLLPITNRQSAARALEHEIAVLETEADGLQRRAEQLRADLAEARSNLADVDLTLQPAEQMNRRLADIVELAGASGMVIDETQTDEVQRHTSHSTVPVALTGTGSYTACAQFLHELSRALPDVKVLGFELSGNAAPGSGNDSFSFDLAWYAAPAIASADAETN